MTVPVEKHTIIVRPAAKKDAKAVVALVKLLAAEDQRIMATFSEKNFLEDAFGVDRQFSMLIAEYSGKPIGFVTYYPGYAGYSGSRGVHLGILYVLPQFRRMGVSTRLMSELSKVAIARKWKWMCWTVINTNDKALKFYEKIGAKLRSDTAFMVMHESGIKNLTERS
jgi:GNAT superfamily N-acetyltransferase